MTGWSPTVSSGRVVPSPAELVARVVVRRAAIQTGLGPSGASSRKTNDLLPVRLVVVGALECRAVVVHEVEVQVLEHDPAVGCGRRARSRRSAGRRSRHGAYLIWAAAAVPPGTVPRSRSEAVNAGVDEPGEQPDAGQPAGAWKTGRSGRRRQRASSSGGSGCWTRRRNRVSPGGEAHVASRSGVSSPTGDESLAVALGRPDQQVALGEVAVDGGREEQLAVVVADDRARRPAAGRGPSLRGLPRRPSSAEPPRAGPDEHLSDSALVQVEGRDDEHRQA